MEDAIDGEALANIDEGDVVMAEAESSSVH